MHRTLRRALAAGLLLAVVGCTSVNERLNPANTPLETRRNNSTRAALGGNMIVNVYATSDERDPSIRPATTESASAVVEDVIDDGHFVGIAISGGGSRSANFAAACLFQLQKLGLLQRADYISSVSGGSITAAYYCVGTDEEWSPNEVQRRFTHSFASDLTWRTFMPWNMLWMAMSDWDRTDVLADSFQEVLFTRGGKKLAFGDLRSDRPKLLINATDLQSAKPFVFCDETFDQINSDLSKYPLGHAVAASSAVPILLHQVTLRDFSTVFKQYRHLIDGGVVDNLGVRTLVDTYRSQLRATGGKAYPRGAIIVVIDASTNYDARLSSRGDTSLLEALKFGANISSAVLLNRANSATLAEIILDSSPDDVSAAELRRERDMLLNDGFVRLERVQGRPVYVLHLALSRLGSMNDVPFKTFSQSVNSIATYFNISGTEAYRLYQAAELLVGNQFSRQLAEITAELNSSSPTWSPATRLTSP